MMRPTAYHAYAHLPSTRAPIFRDLQRLDAKVVLPVTVRLLCHPLSRIGKEWKWSMETEVFEVLADDLEYYMALPAARQTGYSLFGCNVVSDHWLRAQPSLAALLATSP